MIPSLRRKDLSGFVLPSFPPVKGGKEESAAVHSENGFFFPRLGTPALGGLVEAGFVGVEGLAEGYGLPALDGLDEDVGLYEPEGLYGLVGLYGFAPLRPG